MHPLNIIKYPRTPHIEGSRLQPGDENLNQIPFEQIRHLTLTLEEKVDGANVAISFDSDLNLRLQSRGHLLTGGAREGRYDLFKQWAAAHQDVFRKRIGSRYIIYGEWLYVKHRLFYDALPHYFLEFDMLDTERDIFLDTDARAELLSGLPVVSVPVLARGNFSSLEDLTAHLTHSRFITDAHTDILRRQAESLGLDPGQVAAQTDLSTYMEGIYIKVEQYGAVTQRMKFVRPSFAQIDLPEQGRTRTTFLTNQLCRPLTDIFANCL